MMTDAEMEQLVEKVARAAFGAGARRASEQPCGQCADVTDGQPDTTWEQAEDAAVLAAWETLTEAIGEPCYWCGKKTLGGYHGHHQVTCAACAARQEERRAARLAEFGASGRMS